METIKSARLAARTLLAGATILALTACVAFQDAPISPDASAVGFTSRTLHDPGLQEFLKSQGVPRNDWSFDQLALAAVYFRRDIAVAKAEAEEAKAKITTAGQRPNPVFSFAPGYNATSSGISPWILTPTLDVTIETADKRGLRLTQARAEVEAAQLRVAAAAWVARKEIREAMLDLYTARQISNLLETELTLHEEGLKMLRFQVEAGEYAAIELPRARLALNRTRLARHDAKKRTATALARLAAAVGLPSAALNAVSLNFAAFSSLPRDPGSRARRQALTTRADLLALLADYAAADAALRLEIARQYPNIQLSPGYELDQTDNKWSLGFAVELPVLNQNRGPIAEAEARRKTLAGIFEAKQAEVFGEIELARAALRNVRAKVNTAGKLAEEATHASETTKNMVDAGELAPLELTLRRIEATAAALALEEARNEAQQAAGDLEAAVQAPTS